VLDHPTTHDLPRLGGTAYRNPLESTDGARHTRPDPFVVKHRGRYYCYATDADGVTVSVSDDLVTWDFEGFALQLPDRRNYWAPCVIYHDGTFYLYVSSVPAESVDSHDERLHLATSDNPLGPFTVRRTFFDKFSIDPHVVRDHDGTFYIFYSTNDVTGLNEWNAGTSILVDRLIDFDQFADEPKAVVIPTLPEEIFEEDRFGDGRDWHTIEGATFIRHHGRTYLTYSGNAYVRENYFVGYSRAIDGGSIADLTWTKYPSDNDFLPLIRRNELVEGTGHNSIVTGPNLVDQWIVYHGREAAEALTPDTEQRTMRIDPLLFDGDRLSTNAPSSAEQDAPARPDLHDLFIGETMGELWVRRDGTWTTGDYAVHTSGTDARSLAITGPRFGSYRAEIDLAATLDHAGARFGIVPAFFSDDDFIELAIDAGARLLTVTRVRHGVEQVLATRPLPAIHLGVFHRLQVDRSLDLLSVQLDDVLLLTTSIPEGDAAFGLLSTHTEAHFSGLSITSHVELWGASLGLLGRFYTADPRTSAGLDGIVSPIARRLEMHSVDHPGQTAYEHEFEVLSRARGRVEYYAEFTDENNNLRVDADWSTVQVTRTVSGEEELLATASLASPRFSVRTVILDDRLALRIGTIALVLPTTTQQVTQRISLTTSKLWSFQATSMQGTHQREGK